MCSRRELKIYLSLRVSARVAVMCAEARLVALSSRPDRRLLESRRATQSFISSTKPKPKPTRYTSAARIVEGKLSYRGYC